MIFEFEITRIYLPALMTSVAQFLAAFNTNLNHSFLVFVSFSNCLETAQIVCRRDSLFEVIDVMKHNTWQCFKANFPLVDDCSEPLHFEKLPLTIQSRYICKAYKDKRVNVNVIKHVRGLHAYQLAAIERMHKLELREAINAKLENVECILRNERAYLIGPLGSGRFCALMHLLFAYPSLETRKPVALKKVKDFVGLVDCHLIDKNIVVVDSISSKLYLNFDVALVDGNTDLRHISEKTIIILAKEVDSFLNINNLTLRKSNNITSDNYCTFTRCILKTSIRVKIRAMFTWVISETLIDNTPLTQISINVNRAEWLHFGRCTRVFENFLIQNKYNQHWIPLLNQIDIRYFNFEHLHEDYKNNFNEIEAIRYNTNIGKKTLLF